MLILAIDTSVRAGSLALLRDSFPLRQLANDSEEPYSSRLVRDLDRMLTESHITLREVDLYAVVAGPGSFTGLRVGLTAVKAWAEVFRKPVAAISGLAAVAAQLPRVEIGGQRELVAPVLDARRGQIFGGLYECSSSEGDGVELCGEEVVASAEEFLDLVGRQSLGRAVVIASPTPEVIAPALAQSGLRGARLERVSCVLAPVVGRLGYARARRGEVVDSLRLDANYLRRSDAELNWKGP